MDSIDPVNIRFSKRAVGFPESAIRGLGALAADLSKRGVEVIPLNIGAPDLDVPDAVRTAGARYFSDTKDMRYGPSAGEGVLIGALIRFYGSKLGYRNIKDENLLITQGASEALELALYTVADRDDEILVPDPCYSNYMTLAYKYGVKLKPIPADLRNGFHILRTGETEEGLYDRLSKAITPQTRAILWSSPGNPTGTVFNETELRVFLRLSRAYGLTLIADEVYRLITFENLASESAIPRALSILDLASESDRERIIVLDSMSKMLSFCSGRIGVILAPQGYIRSFTLQASTRGCSNIPSQMASSAISSVPDSYFDQNRKTFRERRDALVTGLRELVPMGIGLSSNPPEGAFYLIADLGEGIIADNFCRWLVSDYVNVHKRNVTVLLTPMSMAHGGFYVSPRGNQGKVRMAYVIDKESLAKSVSVLHDAIGIYKKERGV